MSGKRRPAYTDYRNQPLFSGLFLSVLFHLFLLTMQFGVSALRSSSTNGESLQPLALNLQLAPAANQAELATPDAKISTEVPASADSSQTPQPSVVNSENASQSQVRAFQLVDPQPIPSEANLPKNTSASRQKPNQTKAKLKKIIAQDRKIENGFVLPVSEGDETEKKLTETDIPESKTAQNLPEEIPEVPEEDSNAKQQIAQQLEKIQQQKEQQQKEQQKIIQQREIAAKAEADAQAKALAQEQARALLQAKLEAEKLARAEQARVELQKVEQLTQMPIQLQTLVPTDALKQQDTSQQQQMKRQQTEQLAQFKQQQIRLAQENTMKLETSRAEAARIDAEKIEAARIETAKAEQAKIEAVKLEMANLLAEKLKSEKLQAEKLQAEKIAAEKLELARLEAAKLAQQQAQQQAQKLAEQQAQQQAQKLAEQQAAAAQSAKIAAEKAAQLASAGNLSTGQGNGPGNGKSALPRADAGTGSGQITTRQQDDDVFGSGLPNPPKENSRGLDILRGAPPLPRQKEFLERPRRYTSTEAQDREVPVRLYVESWRQKIERNGGLNYSRSSKNKARAEPVVIVALRSDGSVEEISIVRSSGRADLDAAIRNIVRLNAPYAVFPANLANKYDVIEIRRVWSFEATLQIQEEMR